MRQRKDGTTFAASVTSSPVRNAGGELIGAASIARDMTEPNRVRAAAALLERAHDIELASENLTSFTAAVSHDLRDSLRVLSGYSEALLEEYSDRLGGEGRGYAERIAAASNNMSALIEDMLRLSRLARAEVSLQVVDLGAQVALIADRLQREQPGRSVRFVIQRPVRACADVLLVQVALQNLVENAWKFTSGQAGASIEFGTVPAGDAAVCCYVRDNGAGFDPPMRTTCSGHFSGCTRPASFPARVSAWPASSRSSIATRAAHGPKARWGRRDLLLHPQRRGRRRGQPTGQRCPRPAAPAA